MDGEPGLILLGYGVSDTLQLTLEAQRVINRVGKVYGLRIPANLKRLLRAQRVDFLDLADRFSAGRPYADAYLDVAEFILRRTAEEKPVVVLSQGSPLYLNALNRFLMQQARTRGIATQVLPGVSPFDVIVSDLGLDIGTFGLQLFDARRLVSRQQQINPHVPLLVLQPAGFEEQTVANGDGAKAKDYGALVDYLRRFYEAEQPNTLISLNDSGAAPTKGTVTLARFDELVSHVDASSSLYIGAVQHVGPGAGAAPEGGR